MIQASELAEIGAMTLFSEFPAEDLPGVLSDSAVHHFGPGSVLLREGEPANYLHIALDGAVLLRTGEGVGTGPVVEFLGAGEPFIAAAVILSRPYLMTAETIDQTRVLLMPAENFRVRLAKDARLSLGMNRVMAWHWRQLVGQIKEMKTHTATERLAAFLLALSDRQSGSSTITLPCDRALIATRLGMVPESLSRAFQKLRAHGVEGRGRRVFIQSVEKLRLLCGQDVRREAETPAWKHLGRKQVVL